MTWPYLPLILIFIILIFIFVFFFIMTLIHRRHPSILTGSLPSTLIRLTVLALVMLGIGKRAQAQTRTHDPSTAPAVPALGAARVIPLSVHGKPIIIPDGHDAPRSKEFPVPLTDALAQAWAITGNRFQANPPEKPQPLEALTSEIDTVAATGQCNAPFIARQWQRTPDVQPADADKLAAIYAKLEDLARADNALILAAAHTGPITQTGWMSKASPGPASVALPPSFVDTAKKLFPTTDAGLWESDGTLAFRLPDAKDSPNFTLIRRNQKIPLKPGEFVQLRRLDILLIGPAPTDNTAIPQATHRTLGPLNLPFDTVLTARDAATLMLTPDATKKITDLTTAALEGDADAVHLLEMALPLTAPTLLQQSQTHPTTRGAPALRMILQEFDGQ